MLIWALWTVLELPGLESPTSEGAADSTLGVLAGVCTVLYVVAALRSYVADVKRFEAGDVSELERNAVALE